MRALSVDIFAFFITETEGPTQVTNTNFALLLISSPVYNKMIDAMNKNHQILIENCITIIWILVEFFVYTYTDSDITETSIIVGKC